MKVVGCALCMMMALLLWSTRAVAFEQFNVACPDLTNISDRYVKIEQNGYKLNPSPFVFVSSTGQRFRADGAFIRSIVVADPNDPTRVTNTQLPSPSSLSQYLPKMRLSVSSVGNGYKSLWCKYDFVGAGSQFTALIYVKDVSQRLNRPGLRCLPVNQPDSQAGFDCRRFD